ncbi:MULTISPECIES: ArsR/SmtB family transcription factor [unclassified Micromonospora]|uniref:ArsR/SmtB family transcription factor n=1 Tax=unclassified Micromonospora TaxID=2617518 RepID=UPI003A8B1F0F
MASSSGVQQITDVATLKAVAHPLRVKMLSALRFDGPATATQLGRRFGESSGVTSYHLRQLAKYGFIEEEQEQPNARERRWRAIHLYTSLDRAELVNKPEGRQALRMLQDRQWEIAFHNAQAFFDELAEGEQGWIDSAGQSDFSMRLTPALAAELHRCLAEVVREYSERDCREPDARQVSVFLSVFPVNGVQE